MRLSEPARTRRDWNYPTRSLISRTVCWVCGLREHATIHGSEAFWQHDYVPAILTRVR